MELEALRALLRGCGIVGAGGAGFPTYAKLSDRADTVLLNCAECEPLLKLHQQLLEARAPEILRALQVVARAMGAGRVIVCVKAAYRRTAQVLRACMPAFGDMRLQLLDSAYPMGDEVLLTYEATGRVVRPGGLPLEAGVVVFNVETLYNVSRALDCGAPVTDKLVTVAGAVARPLTVRVPLGMAVEELAALAGGAQVPDPAYLLGGPMMGTLGSSMQPVTKTTNAVLVLPREHPLVLERTASAAVALKRAASACCQCQCCTDLCPRHLLGHPIEPHLFMRCAANGAFRDANVFLNTMFCSGCGVCELYACPQGLSPRTLIARYKDGLRAAGVPVPRDVQAGPVSRDRGLRAVPEERLEARVGISRYSSDAPLDETLREAGRVKLLFSQHIGAPAVPAAARGDRVRRGDVLARPAQGLSVAVHASVTGRVVEINDQFAILERDRGNPPPTADLRQGEQP